MMKRLRTNKDQGIANTWIGNIDNKNQKKVNESYFENANCQVV